MKIEKIEVFQHDLPYVLDTRGMVSQNIAAIECTIEHGGVCAPESPGLSRTPDLDIPGDPNATYS